jgi:hypothetical protein
LSHFFRARAK